MMESLTSSPANGRWCLSATRSPAPQRNSGRHGKGCRSLHRCTAPPSSTTGRSFHTPALRPNSGARLSMHTAAVRPGSFARRPGADSAGDSHSPASIRTRELHTSAFMGAPCGLLPPGSVQERKPKRGLGWSAEQDGPQRVAVDVRAVYEAATASGAKIRVIGVGGAGGNAVNRMITSGMQGVEYFVVNTDEQALLQSVASNRIQIGGAMTRGLGTGGNPLLGEQAALESKAALAPLVDGADMIFITAGMGGGTGSGAAPVIAHMSQDAGALTVGVVSVPFRFEGGRRRRVAMEAAEALGKIVDTLIVIPNEKLLAIVEDSTSLTDAFYVADDVLRKGVQGISDIILIPGLINVDFADVKAVIKNSGTAMMGCGFASGKNKAVEAALSAINAPFNDGVIGSAKGIVYNITGGRDLSLMEVQQVSEVLTELADPDCNIIFGAVVDEAFDNSVQVTIVATGLEDARNRPALGTGTVNVADVQQGNQLLVPAAGRPSGLPRFQLPNLFR